MTNFSIIIPIYNVEAYLENCIISILNNSYSNYEIILVNDASSDKCLNICRRYVALYKCIRLINLKRNKGVVNACKMGLLMANFDYIVFIDPDDSISNNFFEEIKNIIEKNYAEMVVVGVAKKYIDGRCELLKSNFKDLDGLYNEVKLKEIVKDNLISECTINDELMHFFKINKIFKKEILLKNFKYLNNKVSIFDGYLFSVPSLMDVNSIFFYNKPLYNYNVRDNSLIHTRKSNQVFSNHIFFLEMFKIFKDKNLDNRKNVFAISVSLSSINRILQSTDSYFIKWWYIRLLKRKTEFKICLKCYKQFSSQLNSHQLEILELIQNNKIKTVILNYVYC